MVFKKTLKIYINIFSDKTAPIALISKIKYTHMYVESVRYEAN